MAQNAELLKEIDKLPPHYFAQVSDFVGYLRQKAQHETDSDTAAYEAMAADTDREMEAREWCGAYFGPTNTK